MATSHALRIFPSLSHCKVNFNSLFFLEFQVGLLRTNKEISLKFKQNSLAVLSKCRFLGAVSSVYV